MKKAFKGAGFYIVLLVAIFLLISFVYNQNDQAVELETSRFLNELRNGNVQSVVLEENDLKGVLKDGKMFHAYVPNLISSPVGAEIHKELEAGNIKELDGHRPQETMAIFNILAPILMIGLFIVFWFVFMQNSQGGGGKVMNFGKSRARLHKAGEDNKITFADVAGLDEEKEELVEVVDFLRKPKKYTELGARIPKGILMVGPPGTGKTYLSKACAGEAGVPFFSISGSDFVEMFVGVGASRVRDLFESAKKNSPCIVFIDEIDAVGRKRGAGLGGGHDEREQTLNQLLVEMDGFTENQGIIIIAATNRADILDPALLRPGRFDRQISVGYPDVDAREKMLAVHCKDKPIADSVKLRTIARATPGFTPADLENLLNEAAILSARHNENLITMKRIDDALTKIMMGVEKKSHIATESDRKITAYHEGGHALLAKLLPNTEPVHQITIIQRGNAAGFVLRLPNNDDQHVTKSQMENRIMVALGGRLAEKIIFKDVSTGASSDLEHVTKVARAMVTQFAMSENLSQMSYDTSQEVFLGRSMSQTKELSEQVLAEIDREVSLIVDTLYEKAYRLLSDNLDKLHLIAKTLLEYETINGEEFDALMESGRLEVIREIRAKNDGKMAASVFKMVEDEAAEDKVVEEKVAEDKAVEDKIVENEVVEESVEKATEAEEQASDDDKSEE